LHRRTFDEKAVIILPQYFASTYRRQHLLRQRSQASLIVVFRPAFSFSRPSPKTDPVTRQAGRCGTHFSKPLVLTWASVVLVPASGVCDETTRTESRKGPDIACAERRISSPVCEKACTSRGRCKRESRGICADCAMMSFAGTYFHGGHRRNGKVPPFGLPHLHFLSKRDRWRVVEKPARVGRTPASRMTTCFFSFFGTCDSIGLLAPN